MAWSGKLNAVSPRAAQEGEGIRRVTSLLAGGFAAVVLVVGLTGAPASADPPPAGNESVLWSPGTNH